jgi:adenosylcobinamide-GDP ribazoletransferase
MKPLAAVTSALSYFTILPVRSVDEPPDAQALLWLPVVGAVVGGLSGSCGYGIFVLTRDGLWAAVAAWIASIVLTGAIHLDGFLDSCDGLLASVAPERRRQILKEPAHGTYAVVGMAIVTVVWLAALLHLSPALMPAALAAAALLARLPIVWPGLVPLPLVARLGMGVVYACCIGAAVWVLAAGGAAFWGTDALAFWLAFLGMCLWFPMLIHWSIQTFARARLGVQTGDTHGAAIVVSEVALLLILATVR